MTNEVYTMSYVCLHTCDCNVYIHVYMCVRNEFEMKLRLHYLEERLRACLDGDEPLQLHYANVDLRYDK
jgi:hypothetical protein